MSDLQASGYIVQRPNAVLYKNGNRVNLDGTGGDYLDPVKLAPDVYSTARLTSIEINANTATEPNTMTVNISIPIPESDYGTKTGSFMDSKFFDFKSTSVEWKPMDHIEAYFTVNAQEDSYFRVFAGVVANINWAFKGNSMALTLSCKDMMYWLDRSRVSPRWSVSEAVLRAGKIGREETAAVAFNTKYTGKDLKQIIEALLFNAEETQFVALGKVDFASWMALNSKADMLDPIIKKGTLEQQDQIQKTNRAREVSLAAANIKTIQEPMRTIYTDGVRKTKIVNSIAGLTTGAISTASEVLQAIGDNNINRKLIGQYWDNQYLKYIADNYVSFGREFDWAVIPFPYTNAAQPLLIEGVYSTRLELLRELSNTALYEIYQAPQGWMMVKPPLYNMFPITSIDPREVEDIKSSINMDIIRTSITTEGALVAAAGEDIAIPSAKDPDDVGEVQTDTPFPFIQGTYTCLFPKDFKEQTNKLSKKDLSEIEKFDWTQSVDHIFAGTETDAGSYFGFVAETQRLIDGINKSSSTGATQGTSKGVLQVHMEVTKSPKDKPIKVVLMDSGMSIITNVEQQLTQQFIFLYLNNNLSTDVLNGILRTNESYLRYFEDLIYGAKNMLERISTKTANEKSSFSPKTYFQAVKSYIEKIRNTYRNLITPVAERSNIGQKMRDRITATLYVDIENILKNPSLGGSGTSPDMSVSLFNGDKLRGGDAGIAPTELLGDGAKDYDFYREIYSIVGKESSSKPYNTSITSKEYSAITKGKDQRPRNGWFPLDTVPFISISIVLEYTLNQSQKTIGDYNVLEHGFRSEKISNRLVRTQPQAVAFSKYLMHIMNAEAEQTVISLKTLRPDIIPGFPLLNDFDGCVYYPKEIRYVFKPGETASTEITCIVRRRPLWVDASQPAGQSFLNRSDSKIVGLVNPKGHTNLRDIIKYDHEIDRSKGVFLGWEYYGPDESEDTAIRALNGGAFIPIFGGSFDGAVSIPSGKKTTGFSDLRILQFVQSDLEKNYKVKGLQYTGIVVCTVEARLFPGAIPPVISNNDRRTGLTKNKDNNDIADFGSTLSAGQGLRSNKQSKLLIPGEPTPIFLDGLSNIEDRDKELFMEATHIIFAKEVEFGPTATVTERTTSDTNKEVWKVARDIKRLVPMDAREVKDAIEKYYASRSSLSKDNIGTVRNIVRNHIAGVAYATSLKIPGTVSNTGESSLPVGIGLSLTPQAADEFLNVGAVEPKQKSTQDSNVLDNSASDKADSALITASKLQGTTRREGGE